MSVSELTQPATEKRRTAGTGSGRFKKIKRLTASWLRWLHIYASMFGLAVTLFFGATGVTLNHPDWFGESATTATDTGKFDPEWVKYQRPAEPANRDSSGDSSSDSPAPPDELIGVARLEIVEMLRTTHGVTGALGELSGDDREIRVTFKGPGYAADAVIDRSTGEYSLTQNRFGLVAILNDLHKGRDSGPVWSLLVDISAVLLCFISVTGLGLIFFLKLRRMPGVAIAILGTIASVAVYYLAVP